MVRVMQPRTTVCMRSSVQNKNVYKLRKNGTDKVDTSGNSQLFSIFSL